MTEQNSYNDNDNDRHSENGQINYTSKQKIDWKQVIKDVKDALIWFQEQQITPTLRTMFYRLVSSEVIPNTSQAYKHLSRVSVDARKSNVLPWDSFSDEGRLVICNFKEVYQTSQDYVQMGVSFLKNAPRTYTIPRWYDQPHYVEIWIEKLALANTFSSFLDGLEIKIIVNRGYSGWSFLYNNCMRLLDIMKHSGRQVHILYCGDFDPSGDDMDKHLKGAFSYFGLDCIDFQRVAVTTSQIEEFDLPSVPNNQETMYKVNRDTRKNGFIEKYGKLYVVELDALLAIVPDELKTILQRSVDHYFDEDIYKRVLNDKKHSPRYIHGLVNKHVKFLGLEESE